MTKPIPLAEVPRLRAMLNERTPAGAIVRKGVDLLRSVADDPLSAGVVGKNVNCICLRRALPLEPQSIYHNDFMQKGIYFVDFIVALPGVSLAIGNARLGNPNPKVERTAFDALPHDVRQRAPCPCKSGLEYRHCCGKVHVESAEGA